MVSSINSKPNSNAANLDSSNKGRDAFCVTRSNTPPSFEKQETTRPDASRADGLFFVVSLRRPGPLET